MTIKAVKDTGGSGAARGALYAALPDVVKGGGFPGQSGDVLVGFIQQVISQHTLFPGSVESVKRSLAASRRELATFLAESKKAAAEQKANIDDEFATQSQQHSETAAKSIGALEQASTEFAAKQLELVGRLEETHKAYLEHMALKAPATYWEEKARGHRTKADQLRNFVGIYFAVSIVGYGLAIWLWHQPIAAFLLQFQGNAGALFVVAAGFALVASSPLWLARLLVRFYLSEHHLAIDALERTTMTKTYLALTAEGRADEKDRALILGALFRATQDGLVRDAAAPDTGPAAVIAKLMDTR